MDASALKAGLKLPICFIKASAPGELCYLLIADFGLLLEVAYELLWVKNSILSRVSLQSQEELTLNILVLRNPHPRI